MVCTAAELKESLVTSAVHVYTIITIIHKVEVDHIL